ncbi:C39 family peptidase [Cellvibrio sp. ARAG 10.3]|uniref:C39 family peptidase n=1 Tax=Cellvibrio sp. ARAG 10.3 TaxID=3451358 RepID=UPI003F47C986
MHRIRFGIFFSLLLLFSSIAKSQQDYYPSFHYPQPQYVGILSHQMDFVAAAQRNSQWCWAAAIQMVLNYYGININQEQIVYRTYGADPYGQLPNWAGSLDAITRNLNNWSIDNYGRPYRVMASLNWGAPTPEVLLQELGQNRPVIVGYKSGPDTGHAVVITAASYVYTAQGLIIQTVVVRDPWPSYINIQNRGRVEYAGADIASLMQAYWYIRVH